MLKLPLYHHQLNVEKGNGICTMRLTNSPPGCRTEMIVVEVRWKGGGGWSSEISKTRSAKNQCQIMPKN